MFITYRSIQKYNQTISIFKAFIIEDFYTSGSLQNYNKTMKNQETETTHSFQQGQNQAQNLLQSTSYQEYLILIQKAREKLKKLSQDCEEIQKSVTAINITFMDSIFRPGNEHRRQECLRLTSSIRNLCIKIDNQLKDQLKITQEQYEHVKLLSKQPYSEQFIKIHMNKVVGVIWAITVIGVVLGIILGGVPGLFIGLLGGATALILSGIITEGIFVGQKYDYMERVIHNIGPIQAKLKEFASTLTS